MKKNLLFLTGYISLAGLVPGCTPTAELMASRSASDAAVEGPTLARFSDIPIPQGAAMNLERSLILGGAEGWIGRLSYGTSLGPQQMFEFFSREMPAFGWQEVTRVRAKTSVMTFLRGARAATVQITRTTFGGSEVDFTVSPQAGPAGVTPAARGTSGRVTPAP